MLQEGNPSPALAIKLVRAFAQAGKTVPTWILPTWMLGLCGRHGRGRQTCGRHPIHGCARCPDGVRTRLSSTHDQLAAHGPKLPTAGVVASRCLSLAHSPEMPAASAVAPNSLQPSWPQAACRRQGRCCGLHGGAATNPTATSTDPSTARMDPAKMLQDLVKGERDRWDLEREDGSCGRWEGERSARRGGRLAPPAGRRRCGCRCRWPAAAAANTALGGRWFGG